MNTKNNKRKRESKEKIKKEFINLIQTKELNQISVSDICKRAELNRTTFYANYADIYELADSVRQELEDNLSVIYAEEIENRYNSHNFLKLFCHIAENQLIYKTYFKLGYDNNYKILQYDTELAQKLFGNRFVNYHCEFFKSGITAVIKMWLANGCKETPEEIYEIVRDEYRGREH